MTQENIEKLYTQHFDELKAFAMAMCQNAEDAEDIVQDVFVSVIDNAGNIDEKGAKSYLYRAVHNKTIDHYRKNTTHNEAIADIDEIQGSDEDYPQLHNAIKDLPDRQAVAIYLFYWKHMSYEQIAIEMECTIKAVDRLLDKAKGKLRELMTNG